MNSRLPLNVVAVLYKGRRARSMRLLLLAFVVVLLFSASLSPIARAQGTRPITEHGLEQSLRLGGLKEAELIAAIDRRGVDFILNSDTERQLSVAGASAAILAAVRAHYKGSDGTIVTGPATRTAAPPATAPAVTAATSPAPVRATTPQAPGIYVQRGPAVWAPLHGESTEYVSEKVSRVFGKASGGLLKLKGDVNGEIGGEHSNITVQSPATFLIRMPGGMSATDYLLVHTHPKHDNREFKISGEALRSHDSIDFRIISVVGTALQIEVSQGAGDYAFVDTRSQPGTVEEDQRTSLYTFQIVP